MQDIPVAVGANLELAAKCRALVLERSVAVDQEVMILPVAAAAVPASLLRPARAAHGTGPLGSRAE